MLRPNGVFELADSQCHKTLAVDVDLPLTEAMLPSTSAVIRDLSLVGSHEG